MMAIDAHDIAALIEAGFYAIIGLIMVGAWLYASSIKLIAKIKDKLGVQNPRGEA